MKEEYKPSILDALAFFACAAWNPVLFSKIFTKIMKDKKDSEDFKAKFMEGAE